MENGPKVSVRNMDFDIQSKIMKRNPFLYVEKLYYLDS